MNSEIKNKIILSGITATGHLTLGNYIGAIQNFVKLQSNNQLYIFIANLHAITGNFTPTVLKQNIRQIMALYYACGLDATKSLIFLQSDVSAHTQLAHILLCHTTVGELSRMTQYKSKNQDYQSTNKTKFIPTGLLTYPCLMAADILLYDADYIPVGADQKQHIELARNIAQRMNKKYKTQLFKIPINLSPAITSKIMDLQNPTRKMSKSSPNPKTYISLLDGAEVVTKKIMSAVTDSENKIYFDPEKKPGISNLMVIYSALTNQPLVQVATAFKEANYQEFKSAVADAINHKLAKIQSHYDAILASDQLDNLLHQNQKIMNQKANVKLALVETTLGLRG